MIRNKKLIALEDIVVDKKLPKYQKERNKVTNNDMSNDSGINFVDSVPMSMSNGVVDFRLQELEYIVDTSPTVLNKLKLWVYRKFYLRGEDRKKPKKKITLTSLVNFFDDVKDGMNKINSKKIDTVISRYEDVLDNAKSNNQTALIEKIEDYAEVLKQELVLATSKFNRYMTEEDIVNFHEKASVHGKYNTCLCLTYVKNFTKVIPKEVTSLKEMADELKVFDNYVVLHYDYDGAAVADTKEEIERKKDPVLFGVIQGSTNLYYIGDWIDDYCDLTLDQIIEAVGKEKKLSTKNVENNLLEEVK